MGQGNRRIEWTEGTWNPVTGCSKLSAGCAFCYAEVFAKRLQAMGAPGYEDGFAVSDAPASIERTPATSEAHHLFRKLNE